MSADHAASRFAGPTGSHHVTAPTPPTIEQQLAFATATCRHGSFQQYRGGGSNDLVPGFVTALQAVTSGHPYLGRTHPWIWAIDVDQPDHPHYQLLKTALADAGLNYVEADSGGSTRAGRHVFVNVAVNDPARTTIITGLYPSTSGGIHMRSMVALPDEVKLYPQFLREAGYYTRDSAVMGTRWRPLGHRTARVAPGTGPGVTGR